MGRVGKRCAWEVWIRGCMPAWRVIREVIIWCRQIGSDEHSCRKTADTQLRV